MNKHIYESVEIAPGIFAVISISKNEDRTTGSLVMRNYAMDYEARLSFRGTDFLDHLKDLIKKVEKELK